MLVSASSSSTLCDSVNLNNCDPLLSPSCYPFLAQSEDAFGCNPALAAADVGEFADGCDNSLNIYTKLKQGNLKSEKKCKKV